MGRRLETLYNVGANVCQQIFCQRQINGFLVNCWSTDIGFLNPKLNFIKLAFSHQSVYCCLNALGTKHFLFKTFSLFMNWRHGRPTQQPNVEIGWSKKYWWMNARFDSYNRQASDVTYSIPLLIFSYTLGYWWDSISTGEISPNEATTGYALQAAINDDMAPQGRLVNA